MATTQPMTFEFSLPKTLSDARKVSWLILKMVIPLYVLTDVLIYLDWIQYLAAPFNPMMSALNLPPEAALAVAAGVFLNIYAALALAAPLNLSGYEWTILGVFLGVMHSMPVETAVMRQLGVSVTYSVALRFVMAWIAVLPLLWINPQWLNHAPGLVEFTPLFQAESLGQALWVSLQNALILALEVIALIALLMVLINYLRARPWVQKHLQNVGVGVSMVAGQLLGITYGAGVLISEARAGHMSREQIFYVASFLMVCHSVIEDGLLFALFGADYWVMMVDRLVFAFISAGFLLWLAKRRGYLQLWMHSPIKE